MTPKPQVLYWFVHQTLKPQVALGFVRGKNGKAYVIGGKTGSHFTGHGESYWDKLREIIQLGYVPADVAKDLRLVPVEWSPPAVADTDKAFLEMIQSGTV